MACPRDRRLLVWILLVSVLVQCVTCKVPVVKRTSSTCHCLNKGLCVDKGDDNQVCLCTEGYNGTKCQYDCRGASENECKSFRSWKICVKHWDWMDVCCKETCEGFKNTCLDANPLHCKRWEAHGQCEKNRNYMRTCCGLCFGNPKCKDKNLIQCPLWKKRGECEKNTVWMYNNCLASCLGC